MRCCTLILFLFTFSATFGQIHFVIQGEIDNSLWGNSHPASIKEGDTIKCNLLNYKKILFAKVKDGKFRFESDLEIPSIAMVSHARGGVLALVDNSSYTCRFQQYQKAGNMGYEASVETASPLS
ncbi:MAG: hypothetical protein LRY55_13370 [Leadbetterella sp.]|nr:hypothetical protein [Leadbetterella sp.]